MVTMETEILEPCKRTSGQDYGNINGKKVSFLHSKLKVLNPIPTGVGQKFSER